VNVEGPSGVGRTVPQGSWSVDPNLIVEVARREAQATPGVVSVVSAEVTRSGLMERISSTVSGSSPELRGGQVPLELTLIVEYGRCLHELAQRVRERTATAVEGMTGYRVSAVDITVADLHVPGEPLPTREPVAGEPPPGGGRVDF
jgi:uncharacterized alkaline shock family protein YloU